VPSLHWAVPSAPRSQAASEETVFRRR